MSLSEVMQWMLIVLAVLVGLFAADRVLLRLEARGWIYYRKKKPNRVSVGSALLQIHALFEPEKQQIVDVRRDQAKRPVSGDEAHPDPTHPRDA